MTAWKQKRRSIASYLYLPRLISTLVRRLGPKALLLWALLLLSMASFAGGLSDLVSGLTYRYLFLTAALAMTLAWGTALLPMRARLAAALSMLLGMTFLLIRVGGLGDDLYRAAHAALLLLVKILAWPWLGPPELAAIIAPWQVLVGVWSDLAILVIRPLRWIWGIILGRGVFDPVASTLAWGLVMWICASWAGWVARRHTHPLLAIVPGGGLIAFLLAYTRNRSPILLPIIGLTLILMALMRQWSREKRWDRNHIDYSRALWQDMIVIAVVVAVLAVGMASVAPAISINKFVRWVREYIEDEDKQQVTESMGLEAEPERREPSPFERMQRTDLPREHLIGSGPELSQEVVMIVRTGTPVPARATTSDLQASAPRYYWRSLTYNIYTGVGWRTSGIEETMYEPGAQATWPSMTHRRQLRQEIEMLGDIGDLIYVAGTLMAVDQPYEVAWRQPNEIFAATLDVAEMTETEVRGYRADSTIPVVTEEELRAAGDIYPDWILDRYLQLPESTPERLLVLARDLTATEPTPYDRARAIERYLRAFPYNLDVPYAPPGRDIADFFIFDLQEGYCDYYATSMVVLARAAGLPARLVVGYASGSYDAETARYIVTEADAHAWVEIYFPTYGWIEFEPTAGLAVLDRASEADEARWAEDEVSEPLVPPAEDETEFRLGRWLRHALALVVGFIFILSVIDALVLLHLTPPALMRRLYHRLGRYGHWLLVRARPGATPYEFQAAFMRRLDDYPQSDWLCKLLDPMVEEVTMLIEHYVQVFYTPGAPDDSRGVVMAWWRLRWRLWLYWIWRKVHQRRLLIPSGSPPSRPADRDLPRRPLPGV